MAKSSLPCRLWLATKQGPTVGGTKRGRTQPPRSVAAAKESTGRDKDLSITGSRQSEDDASPHFQRSLPRKRRQTRRRKGKKVRHTCASRLYAVLPQTRPTPHRWAREGEGRGEHYKCASLGFSRCRGRVAPNSLFFYLGGKSHHCTES